MQGSQEMYPRRKYRYEPRTRTQGNGLLRRVAEPAFIPDCGDGGDQDRGPVMGQLYG